jgi:hypothetical protein
MQTFQTSGQSPVCRTWLTYINHWQRYNDPIMAGKLSLNHDGPIHSCSKKLCSYKLLLLFGRRFDQ